MMKAEKTRIILVCIPDDVKAAMGGIGNAFEELDKLESDAELGRAVRYLASNHISIPMQYMNDYITDETIEYIVKTAKKVVENC
jgi:hypothetical protein